MKMKYEYEAVAVFNLNSVHIGSRTEPHACILNEQVEQDQVHVQYKFVMFIESCKQHAWSSSESGPTGAQVRLIFHDSKVGRINIQETASGHSHSGYSTPDQRVQTYEFKHMSRVQVSRIYS